MPKMEVTKPDRDQEEIYLAEMPVMICPEGFREDVQNGKNINMFIPTLELNVLSKEGVLDDRIIVIVQEPGTFKSLGRWPYRESYMCRAWIYFSVERDELKTYKAYTEKRYAKAHRVVEEDYADPKYTRFHDVELTPKLRLR